MELTPPPPPSWLPRSLVASASAPVLPTTDEAATDDLVDLFDLNPTVLCDRPLSNANTAQAALTAEPSSQRQLVPCSFVSPPLHVFVCLDRCVRLRRVELAPYYARHRVRSALLFGAASQSQRLASLISRLKQRDHSADHLPAELVARELDACPGLCRLASLRFPVERRHFQLDLAPPDGARIRVAVLRVTGVYPGCLPAFSGLRLIAEAPWLKQSLPLPTPTLPSSPAPPPRSQPPASASSTRSPTPPEEFVDPITFELMQTPVLLPCGKSIDHATLLRCQQSADPFTGLSFTQDRRPVFNAALKLRLDDYLAAQRRRKRAAATADEAEAASAAKRRRFFLPLDLDPYAQLAQPAGQPPQLLPESSCQLCNAKETRHAWYRVPCSRDRVICYACRMSLGVMSCKLCYSQHHQAEFRAKPAAGGGGGGGGGGGQWPA